jgi:hypothetical protein
LEDLLLGNAIIFNGNVHTNVYGML